MATTQRDPNHQIVLTTPTSMLCRCGDKFTSLTAAWEHVGRPPVQSEL